MDKWFTVDRIDEDTYIISEYDEVAKLTDQPVTAAATHIRSGSGIIS